MTVLSDDLKKEATDAAKSKKKLDALVAELAGASRRDRQRAASMIAYIAASSPETILPYSQDLIDALNRPEAQTRWECLDALTNIVDIDSRACDKVIEGAETALYDEGSGPLRLSAMRFLCKYGSTTENRSEKVWPLIDEGIQCYHGDIEFQDMLIAVIDFSAGKLSPRVKEELAERMRFDAENSKGALQRKASQIYSNATK